jgi:ribose/xylose/arabinose/galactoside ABC-type transport system permease subunit
VRPKESSAVGLEATATPYQRQLPDRLRMSQRARRKALAALRIGALMALTVGALATPGFASTLSVFSLLTTMSFIGCVAVGMSFITITGNIMSLCLGATLSASSLVFMASLGLGVFPAFLVAVAFGIIVTAAQGFAVGYLQANPIIVSIAGLALILGSSDYITGGQRIYPGGGGYEIFKDKVYGLPVEVMILFAAVAVGQAVLLLTRFGRNMYLVGSNARAAEAAGIVRWRTVTGAYTLAGLFSAMAGILLASRYGSGDMELGVGFDYDAIAAVLVGGTAIHGGAGSVLRTLAGVAVISAVKVILILRGFSQEMQYLITGLIVLGVVMLHTLGERR